MTKRIKEKEVDAVFDAAAAHIARGSSNILAKRQSAQREGRGAAPTRRHSRKERRRRAKRISKQAKVHPDLQPMAQQLHRCGRARWGGRCRHPACPMCARAWHGSRIAIISTALREQQELEPWGTLTVVLPPSNAGPEIDFRAERERYAAILRAAGLTLGIFCLDLSFNEDDRRELPESERFAPHASVHLHGFAPTAQLAAALPRLKWLVPRTAASPRPVKSGPFDGNPAAIAYALKPNFDRRLTILNQDARRGKPVRNSRDRPLTVEQEIQTVRALDRAGWDGRLLLLGMSFARPGRASGRPVSTLKGGSCRG